MNLSSCKGIPKLQEHLPAEYLPDTLIVHDPDGVTMARDHRSLYADRYREDDVWDDKASKTISYWNETSDMKRTGHAYKRVYPVPSRSVIIEDQNEETDKIDVDHAAKCDSGVEPVGYLYMDSKHRKGTGSHSHVYLSPLKLPEPLSTFSHSSARPGTVLVAAKLAIQERRAREHLASEAATYNEFPRHLSDEYCGLHSLRPEMETLVPSCAVVPKFYGYYVPVYDDDHERGSGPWKSRSPILLVEDCGNAVTAGDLDDEDRYVVLYSHLLSNLVDSLVFNHQGNLLLSRLSPPSCELSPQFLPLS